MPYQCENPVLICEVGQTVGMATSGMPVTIVHAAGEDIQTPTNAVLRCALDEDHVETLDIIPDPDALLMQYPKPGPCEFGDGPGRHPLGSDPGYHVLVSGYCSGKINVYDKDGDGYPKPPMSP